MLASPEITELRVPVSPTTYEALERLKQRLRQQRSVRRVTTRELIHEALGLLFDHYAASVGTHEPVDEAEARDG